MFSSFSTFTCSGYACLLVFALAATSCGGGGSAAGSPPPRPPTGTLLPAPVLFFSDLVYGPNTGWNNGTAQGAAVTIWGRNFGSTQGSNYVTIGGVQAANYAEWDTIGPAEGLERITFYIPSSASTGAGTISVTVNGQTSNALSFTVDHTTPICYIDVTNGNNSNGGRTTATAWKDISKFDPSSNPFGDTQYICYVRGGTYSTKNSDGAFFSTRCTVAEAAGDQPGRRRS